ncbi:NAD(P)/FAD-dependent oxidoreductase [Thermoflexus sp.]|uniref:NAD(P)/FAD-dependent oxidoreductase n=1 Tax=Thermoflexus sp. TaxID=1969742 RepID=UPI0035E465E2
MMARDENSIRIIGGSIAGLFAAWRLAAAGRPVVVYERDEAMAGPRTLIVTPWLRRLWPDFPSEGIRHRITGFDLWAGGVRRILLLREPDWVIERAEVRAYLLQLARSAGAEIRMGWSFVGREGSRLIFRRLDGTEIREESRVILAADGARSRVLAAFGLPRPPVLLLLQARVRLPVWADPGRAMVWFVPEDTPYFYWLIPDSPRSGVLGLATEPGCPIRTLLDRFLGRLGLEPLAYQGGMVATYRPDLPWRVVRDGHVIFPIGDAGGQVKMTTVGGTVTGIWGGMAVAHALLGQGWGMARRLQAELGAHYLVRRVLSRFTREDYERLLWGLGQRAARTLGEVPRDALAAGVWRLLWAQPGLVKYLLDLLREGALADFVPRSLRYRFP